jgi:hypothetical protein
LDRIESLLIERRLRRAAQNPFTMLTSGPKNDQRSIRTGQLSNAAHVNISSTPERVVKQEEDLSPVDALNLSLRVVDDLLDRRLNKLKENET